MNFVPIQKIVYVSSNYLFILYYVESPVKQWLNHLLHILRRVNKYEKLKPNMENKRNKILSTFRNKN